MCPAFIYASKRTTYINILPAQLTILAQDAEFVSHFEHHVPQDVSLHAVSTLALVFYNGSTVNNPSTHFAP